MVDQQFLLNLNNAKVDKLETALEKNWIVHLLLSGVGMALVLNIGHLPEFAASYFFKAGTYDNKVAAAIMLPILLYYFMKFGSLLSSFVAARQLQDRMFGEYLRGSPERTRAASLHETTSFFEVFYSAESFAGGRWLFWPHLLIASLVVSSSQASALFLVVQAYGWNAWSGAALSVSAAILLLLYYGFWQSQRARPRATLVVVFSILFAVGWLVLFAYM